MERNSCYGQTASLDTLHGTAQSACSHTSTCKLRSACTRTEESWCPEAKKLKELAKPCPLMCGHKDDSCDIPNLRGLLTTDGKCSENGFCLPRISIKTAKKTLYSQTKFNSIEKTVIKNAST